MDEVLRFDTLATHAGAEFSSPAAQLEARISALEGAGLGSAKAWGLAFASGRAALDAVARLLRPLDRVIASNDHIEVMLDREPLFSATDRSLLRPGPMGVWSQADSVTHYGSLLVGPPMR